MKPITRRDFVYRSITMGITGTGLAGISSGKETEQTKPNARLGIMIVGCGERGYEHVKAYLEIPCTQILAVSDPDSERMERMANIVKNRSGKRPLCFRDFREGLSLSGLDILSCATPNHWHALVGILAMQAGKDVYLEKPLCHSLEEGKALLAAVKKYDRICQTGLQNRSMFGIMEGLDYKSHVEMDEIKTVRAICYKRRSSCGLRGHYLPQHSLDYNLWSGPAPLINPCTRPNFHYDWNWQRLFGDGEFGNQGAHQIDMARMILGVDEFPESVQTYGGRFGFESQKETATTGKTITTPDAGDTANTEVSVFRYSQNRTIIFELRNLETDRFDDIKLGAIAYGAQGQKIATVEFGRILFYDKKGHVCCECCGSGNHFLNFIAACTSRRKEVQTANAHCGYLSAGLTLLGNISYYLGEKNKVSTEEAKRILRDQPDGEEQLKTLERTLNHLNQNGINLKKIPLAMGPLLKFDTNKESFSSSHDSGSTDSSSSEAFKMESLPGRTGFIVPKPEEV